MNILITSAGRRVSLVKAFKSSSEFLGTNSKVFITDLNLKRSPAKYFADDSFRTGLFSDPSYIDRLLEICLENSISVYPGSQAVKICQDRLKEKNIFNKNSIPTTEYHVVNNAKDLSAAIDILGTDSILKSRKLGYDGKNQIIINKHSAEEAWLLSGKVDAILEKKIDFQTEVSIIGVCTKSSGTLFYPLVENFHKNGILNLSIAPYENSNLQKLAESYHNKIAKELNYIGVLVIEFFLDTHLKMEKFLANSIQMDL